MRKTSYDDTTILECMDVWEWGPSRMYPDCKVYGANMGPTWGRQDPGGPHGGPMNLAIWVYDLCANLDQT